MAFYTTNFDLFLDRKGIGAALDKKERTVLNRAGGFSKVTMSRGMRRKKGPGPAGGYPNAHSGELRKLIYYNYNQNEGGVIIGPLGFSSQPKWLPAGIATVPQLINEGGTATRQVSGKQRRRVYPPRPFVDLTLPVAAKKLADLYEEVPLRR